MVEAHGLFTMEILGESWLPFPMRTVIVGCV
jgi:hypothetical protein